MRFLRCGSVMVCGWCDEVDWCGRRIRWINNRVKKRKIEKEEFFVDEREISNPRSGG